MSAQETFCLFKTLRILTITLFLFEADGRTGKGGGEIAASPLCFEPAKLRVEGFGLREEGGVEPAYEELRLEEDCAFGTVCWDSVEESLVRKLALDRLLSSLKNVMATVGGGLSGCFGNEGAEHDKNTGRMLEVQNESLAKGIMIAISFKLGLTVRNKRQRMKLPCPPEEGEVQQHALSTRNQDFVEGGSGVEGVTRSVYARNDN